MFDGPNGHYHFGKILAYESRLGLTMHYLNMDGFICSSNGIRIKLSFCNSSIQTLVMATALVIFRTDTVTAGVMSWTMKI